jgi:hypothetical protein
VPEHENQEDFARRWLKYFAEKDRKANVMTVRKTVITVKEDGQQFIADTIPHDDKWWIVPEWLQGPTAGTLCPARIISVDAQHLTAAGPPYQDRADWALETPLSRDILDGRRVSQSPLVIERPDIILRVDQDFHR